MGDTFKTHGAFSWFELMTRDPAGSRSFYSELLGWKLEDMPMGDEEPYTVVGVGEEQVAGIMRMPIEVPEHVPTHWGCYVTVDDVDVTAEIAISLGGNLLMPPTDIPGIGRFCTIKDPQGAVISFITYSS